MSTPIVIVVKEPAEPVTVIIPNGSVMPDALTSAGDPNLAGGGGGVTAASATLEPTGANNDLVFTAVTPGTAGNDISVTVAAPAVSAATAVSVTGSAITVTPGTKARMVVSGTPSLTVSGTYEFQAGGPFPNPAYDRWVEMSLLSEIWWNSSLSRWELRTSPFATVGYYSTSATATPDLATDWTAYGSPLPTGTPIIASAISSANQVIAAIAASGPAAALVTAANAAGNDGTGAMSAVVQTFLIGGSAGGSPIAPAYLGQLCRDTTNGVWYRATSVSPPVWELDAPTVALLQTIPEADMQVYLASLGVAFTAP